MKSWLIALVVGSLMFVSTSAFAQNATASTGASAVEQAGNFGLGLGVGTTAAPISLKYFFDSTLSIQGNVGWWRGPFYGCGRGRGNWCGGGYYNNALGVSADVLYEGNGPLAGNQNIALDWEIGGGAGIGVDNYDFGFAAAFVAGLQLELNVVPLDFVLEYRLPVYIVPSFWPVFVDFTGQIRYYF